MARADLDELLSAILPAAQMLLEKNGEFYPLAAVMKTDGVVVQEGIYDGDRHPASQTVIDLYTNAFQQQAREGEIKATAVAYDSRVIPEGRSDKVDAVCTRLEHRDGEAVDVFLPYHKGSLGRIEYGELFAAVGTATIFNQIDAT